MAGKNKSDSKTGGKGKDKGKGKKGKADGAIDGADGSNKLKPATSINVRHILVSGIDPWHMTPPPHPLPLPLPHSKRTNEADRARQ